MSILPAFPGDANVMLQQVQQETEHVLLWALLTRAVETYQQTGQTVIRDADFLDWIRSGYTFAEDDIAGLHLCYTMIADHYRLLHDNGGQLDFDGYLQQRPYHEQAKEDWQRYFEDETRQLLTEQVFLIAVLFAVFRYMSDDTMHRYNYVTRDRTCELFLWELLFRHYGDITEVYQAQLAGRTGGEADITGV